MPMIKPGVRVMNYEDTGVKDIFMPTASAEAEAKRLIRGKFVEAIARYMECTNPPSLIGVSNVVDDFADLMVEQGSIAGYEVEMMKADSQGYHIDMVIHPPGQYWSDMYFTILVGNNYKKKSDAFDRAMKGV